MKIARIFLPFILLSSHSAEGQLPLPQGAEIELSGFEAKGDVHLSRSISGSGEFLVLDSSFDPDSNRTAIRGRLFSREGVAGGEVFTLPDLACSIISLTPVLQDESFLLLWQEGSFEASPTSPCFSPDSALFLARRFSLAGEPLGEIFTINEPGPGDHGPRYGNAGFAQLPDGGFLVSWTQLFDEPNNLGDFPSIHVARRFRADDSPAGPQFRIDEEQQYDAGASRIILGDDGDFFIAWGYYGGEGPFHDVAARHFSLDGTPRGPQHVLTLDGGQFLGDATLLEDGSFLVIVEDESDLAPLPGILVYPLDPSGGPFGPPLRIEAQEALLRSSSRVLRTDTGELLVAWTETSPGSVAPTEVRAQWIDKEARALGQPFQVNGRFLGNQALLSLYGRPDAGAEILFSSTSGEARGTSLRARRLASACSPGPSTLCLGDDGRFRAEVAWASFSAKDGHAGATALTSESGAFWFFRPENVELVVKVVDGQANNGNFWVFYGALSNVEYQLTVTDTASGVQKIYRNPARSFASVGDTRAFAGDRSEARAETHRALDPRALAAYLPDPPSFPLQSLVSRGEATQTDELSFEEGRFLASITWEDFAGNTGTGTPARLTEDTGYFWFFNPERAEVVIKILDGREVNGNFWVFYGALTNVAYTLTVEDTLQGASKSYVNPLSNFGSEGDTAAFPDGSAALVR